MNHGAISVIYLALSAVCLVGLYGVYKPNINAAAGNTFGKVERFTDNGFNISKGNADSNKEMKDFFHIRGQKVGTVSYHDNNDNDGSYDNVKYNKPVTLYVDNGDGPALYHVNSTKDVFNDVCENSYGLGSNASPSLLSSVLPSSDFQVMHNIYSIRWNNAHNTLIIRYNYN